MSHCREISLLLKEPSRALRSFKRRLHGSTYVCQQLCSHSFAWTLRGGILQVLELSSQLQIRNNILELDLGGNGVPNVEFCETDTHVIMVAANEGGHCIRVEVLHPSQHQAAVERHGPGIPSVQSTLQNYLKHEFTLDLPQHTTVVRFTTLGPYLAAALLSNHTVIYASIDSTLSPDESFQVEVTSASTSYVRSLLSGLMFRPQAAKVLDIKGAVLAPNDPSADAGSFNMLLTLCDDGVLRLWSLKHPPSVVASASVRCTPDANETISAGFVRMCADLYSDHSCAVVVYSAVKSTDDDCLVSHNLSLVVVDVPSKNSPDQFTCSTLTAVQYEPASGSTALSKKTAVHDALATGDLTAGTKGGAVLYVLSSTSSTSNVSELHARQLLTTNRVSHDVGWKKVWTSQVDVARWTQLDQEPDFHVPDEVEFDHAIAEDVCSEVAAFYKSRLFEPLRFSLQLLLSAVRLLATEVLGPSYHKGDRNKPMWEEVVSTLHPSEVREEVERVVHMHVDTLMQHQPASQIVQVHAKCWRDFLHRCRQLYSFEHVASVAGLGGICLDNGGYPTSSVCVAKRNGLSLVREADFSEVYALLNETQPDLSASSSVASNGGSATEMVAQLQSRLPAVFNERLAGKEAKLLWLILHTFQHGVLPSMVGGDELAVEWRQLDDVVLHGDDTFSVEDRLDQLLEVVDPAVSGDSSSLAGSTALLAIAQIMANLSEPVKAINDFVLALLSASSVDCESMDQNESKAPAEPEQDWPSALPSWLSEFAVAAFVQVLEQRYRILRLLLLFMVYAKRSRLMLKTCPKLATFVDDRGVTTLSSALKCLAVLRWLSSAPPHLGDSTDDDGKDSTNNRRVPEFKLGPKDDDTLGRFSALHLSSKGLLGGANALSSSRGDTRQKGPSHLTASASCVGHGAQCLLDYSLRQLRKSRHRSQFQVSAAVTLSGLQNCMMHFLSLHALDGDSLHMDTKRVIDLCKFLQDRQQFTQAVELINFSGVADAPVTTSPASAVSTDDAQDVTMASASSSALAPATSSSSSSSSAAPTVESFEQIPLSQQCQFLLVQAESMLRSGRVPAAQSAFCSIATLQPNPLWSLFVYVHAIEVIEPLQHHDVCLALAQDALTLDLDTATQLSANTDCKSLVLSQVFKYALCLEHYDDAYAAMITIPATITRNTAIRRFVIVLSEHRLLNKLCAYPWLGVELRREVEQSLLWKAEGSNLFDILHNVEDSSGPSKPVNFYYVLYAFLTNLRNFRSAAQHMYNYVLRLEQEVDLTQAHLLKDQANALLCCINALQLVPDHQWLSVGTQSSSGAVNSREKRKRTAGDDSKDSSSFGGFQFGQTKATSSSSSSSSSSRGGQEQDHIAVKIVRLHDLRKRFALCNAHLRIAQADPHYRGAYHLSPQNTLTLLLQAGMFDTAVAVAQMFELELDVVFEALVDKCVALQLASDDANRAASVPFVFEEPPPVVVFKGPQNHANPTMVDAAWSLLHQYLTRFDSVDTNFDFTKLAASRLLEADRRVTLPLWLISLFRERGRLFAGIKRNPLPILRLMTKHNLEDLAAELSIQCVQHVVSQLEEDLEYAGHMWLPFSFFDELLKRLSILSSTSSAGSAKRLRDELLDSLRQLAPLLAQYEAAKGGDLAHVSGSDSGGDDDMYTI